VDVDLDVSPEALEALDLLADLIQRGGIANEEEEDINEQKEPTAVPDVMPSDEGEDDDDDQNPQTTPEQAARLNVTKELVWQIIVDTDRLAKATSPIVGPTQESTPQMEDEFAELISIKFLAIHFILWTVSKSLFTTNGKQPISQPCKKQFSYMTTVKKKRVKNVLIRKKKLGMSSYRSTSIT
jgi:hypothetical protein